MSHLFNAQDLLEKWQQNSSVFYTTYTLLLAIILLMCAISLIYIAGKSASEQQKWLLLTLIGFFMTLFSYFGEVTSASVDTMLFVVKMGHIAKVLSTLCFLKYTSSYCKVKISAKWMNLYYLYIIGISICILISDKVHVFYKSFTINHFANMPYFSATHGVMFYIYSFGLCAAIFVVLFMIGQRMVNVNVIERKRLRFLFCTGLIPVMGYVFTILLPFPMLDFVPITFGISAILLYIASKQHGLLDVVSSAKENLIENTKEGIVVVDNEYNVLYANQAASELIDHVFDYKQGKELELFIDFFTNEKSVMEIKGRMYEVSVSNIYEKTKIRGKRAWFFDVTESQNYTKEILRLKDEAERANMAKTTFLANMSHEIRTPMNAILGFSELVIQMEKQENIKDYMYDIKRSAKSLLHIINQILDISKIESGEIEIVEEEFYLQTLLEDVVAIIMSQASKKGLKCSGEFAKDIPSQFYGADVQLKEILINILNNAVKYTKEGEITLSVYCEELLEDSVKLCFKVSDTGIGMKKEDLDKIYDRFRKFDSMNNQGIEGSGLGMYIVKSLVKSLNGTIGIDSTYGEGTTMKIVVPLKIVNRTPMGKLEVKRGDEESSRKKIIANAKILVVDDNEVNLRLISSLLLRYQIHPDLAVNGENAIEKIQKESYDLIYMDHMMPGMDGVQTMQYIREMENGRYKKIPIILLTANAIAGFREEMLAAGFWDYISKPIDIKYLEETLVKYLPAEKITLLEEEPEDEVQEETHNVQIEAIQSVLKHFQVEEGIKYCGGRYEDYLEILKITLQHGDDRILKLRKLFEQKDYHTYTIDVHALKSTAYNIGAVELGDEAKEQELAGKNENYKYIEEHFELLIEEYQIVLLEMRKWFYLKDKEEYVVEVDSAGIDAKQSQRQQISNAVTYPGQNQRKDKDEPMAEIVSDKDKREALIGVKRLVEEYEMDRAKAVLQQLYPMLPDENEKQQVQEMMTALEDWDMEKVEEGLEKLVEKGKNV